MASFSRSFKPPSYLALGRRPGMSGRALSTTSEMSSPSGSPRSDVEAGRSGRNTPLDEAAPGGGGNGPTAAADLSPATVPPSSIAGEASSSFPFGARIGSPRLSASRPIAIELPTIRKINTAPAYTPPEPLSARGDLPGGYFPHHEDPKARIHRPHPFHADAKKARHHSMSLAVESAPPAPMPDASRYPLPGGAVTASPDSRSHTPVTSYMPSGVHDSPMPLGKYYPSNYENRQRQGPQPPPAAEASASLRAEHGRRSDKLSTPRTDSDARRRLQQYQRDMIAQATMAASQVLGRNADLLASTGPTTLALNGVPLRSLQLGNPTVSKPTSPRLIPLGSPGPVTPMDLADPGSGGGYLDRGRGSPSPGIRGRPSGVPAGNAS